MRRMGALTALLGLALAACRSDTPASALSTEEVVIFEGALASRYTPAREAAPVTARLHLGARAPEAERRTPANVALVVDTSGSMEGQPIADARAAAVAMVDRLRDGDRLAVIAFGSRAEVLVPPAELDEDSRAEARAKLGQMRAEGTTDMGAGLRAGLDALATQLDPRGLNRVVLLGDGVPNDAAQVQALAEEARSRGVTITALGLGADYDETLMGAIAQRTGGRFHYVDDSSRVAAFFEAEVLRLEGSWGRSAALEITPGPGVRVEEVIGQRPTWAGAKVRVELGDLSRGEERDLFVRFQSDARRAGAPVELCDAVLSYTAPGGERVERRVFLGARASDARAEIEGGRDAAVEEGAALAQAAAVTVTAIELARAGRGGEARALLTRTAAEVDESAARLGSKRLREEASALRGLASDLPAPAPPAPMPAPRMPAEAPAPAAAEPAPTPAAATPVPPEMQQAQARKIRAGHDHAMQQLQ